MFNTDLPTRAELPTAEQLARSTRRALLAAAAILILVVLPAEYGVDPTRVGRLLGLTEMGEIKTQLAAEAAADAAATATAEVAAAVAAPPDPAPNPPAVDPDLLAAEVQRAVALALAERTADAAAPPAPEPPQPVEAAGRSDELVITLAPGEGAEVKLAMRAGAFARFRWTVDGGVANYDMHADGEGDQSVTYDRGRGVPGQEGTLEAAFDGNHGWFWRNRGDEPITILLRTDGDYAELKRLV